MRQAQGIYMISVVAEILEMHPQTLRKYERAGFIEPPRMGTLRTYSDEDIARLRLIKHFVDDLGLNLAGVQLALNLTHKLLKARAGLFSQSALSGASAEAFREIDSMLADLGLHVVQEPKAGERDGEEKPQLPPPQGPWFNMGPSEAIEFTPSSRKKANR